MTRTKGERTYSRAQQKIRDEFIKAYGFHPEQIGFDGKSEEPIFDFDALCVLVTRLCDLPHVEADFGLIEHSIQMATSNGYAILKNGNTRRIFGSAVVGEVLHDGTAIETIHQAVKVSRARALRTILRAVGFDPVAAHREFTKSGKVLELVLPAKAPGATELAEIHILAEQLDFIKGNDKTVYRRQLASFFPGKDSALKLDDKERALWLSMLRAWARAKERATA